MTDFIYTNVNRKSSKMQIRGINLDTGKRVSGEHEYHPTLFLPSKNPTPYKNLDGVYVEAVNPGTMWECKEFIDQYSGVSGLTVYGMTSYPVQWIADAFEGEDINELAAKMYDKIRIGILDIECQSENGFPNTETADEEINVITVYIQGKSYVFGVGEFHLTDPNTPYQKFDTEKEMLEAFLYMWNKFDLDVVSGYNIDFFDIPYLFNRLRNVLGDSEAKKLSPWGKVRARTAMYFGQPRQVFSIEGMSVLDYQRLYQKYRLIPRESYKLDFIGQVEVNAPKLDWKSEHATMHDFYTNDFQKFVEYNIKDVEIVKQLEDKLKLLELHIMIAYLAGVNYEDVFSQVRTWEAIIYNHLRSKGIVTPQKKNLDKSEQFKGAFVRDPEVGYHKWIVSFDLASLYPSIIRQVNLSPETLVKNKRISTSVESLLKQKTDTTVLKSSNHSLAANGCVYDRSTQGFLPALMEDMYNQRKIAKKEMLHCYDDIEEIKKELQSRGIEVH